MIPVCDPLFNNLFDKKYFPDTIALQIAVAVEVYAHALTNKNEVYSWIGLPFGESKFFTGFYWDG